ncbi:sulfurtransferase [Solitalea canadensis]|uniref:Rhodanese-related sulfurtransferase n=1 Tax=Solitalea canadensis (strain ATCC 29591 / DSM 3403 / JCM 21819 / LMG 8368 / NBRC 15130 / NCIMB 12057 / USAM 9D) TaxID=929556 RepID=H8KU68_SOLCM|nr:sulfurtransferase [Solitalea canadensis]AFD07180.1 rhodanese-related sulfurtransferase [Solitalea canadensis DSM 3403]
MSQQLSPLIKPEELLSLYQKKEKLTIVDATNAGQEKYLTSHLDGALFVDLDTQLADIKADVAVGGRHPLPTFSQFSETLSQLGITPESHVVIYDDKNGSNAAARFWWMLKSVGHQNVQVLDGGFQAAVKAGFPVNDKTVAPQPVAPYKIEGSKLPLADISLIDKASQDENFLIIDVRDEERYNGEIEPIDLIAGHIPNAVNIPFTTNLDEHGFFLSREKLHDKYTKAFENVNPENIIVHCGSGVTACHTLLAIDAAGMEIPKLYVGSWSEWSRNNKPMVTKM